MSGFATNQDLRANRRTAASSLRPFVGIEVQLDSCLPEGFCRFRSAISTDTDVPRSKKVFLKISLPFALSVITAQ